MLSITRQQIFLLALVACVAACGGSDSVEPPKVAQADTIVLTPSPLVAHVSDYVFVTATVYDVHGQRMDSPGLKWSAEDPSIAYLSITADTVADLWGKSVGTTAISASFGGKTTRITFAVQPMVVSKVILAPGVAAVPKGGQRKLGLTELNSHDMAVFTPVATWTSSDSSIASVDQAGNITARSEGTVQIEARFDTLSAVATVHVPSPFAAVVVGGGHACGLKQDGRAFCWGSNEQGQLGDGSVIDRPAPVLVSTSMRFASLYALGMATCGLTGGGSLYCWGSNDNGRLGVAGPSAVSTPTLVSAPEAFSSVAAGGSHICAVGVSGKSYCWGFGSATGATQDPVSTPTEVPTPVSFTSLVAGNAYTCGLGVDQRAYCWGVDYAGQLADSVPDASYVRGRTTILPIVGGHTFTNLFAGPSADNTCGLDATGSSWCWGDYVENDAASTTVGCYPVGSRCSPVPVRVTANVQFKLMTAGLRSDCALDGANQAYCWGLGYDDRGITFAPLPSKVVTDLRFQSIVTGSSFQCGLSASGLIYCWGSNNHGQVGDYSAVPSPGSPYGLDHVVSPSLIAGP